MLIRLHRNNPNIGIMSQSINVCPWSRHHACTDGPTSLMFVFKCSLKFKGESQGEKNSKNCLKIVKNS